MKHKFNAKPTTIDDKKFPSKLEASYYQHLKNQQAAGTILFFLRQIPFDLPGKVKYLADFEVFYPDGTIEFIDVKGRDTPLSILKRKQVEALYPLTIKIISKV